MVKRWIKRIAGIHSPSDTLAQAGPQCGYVRGYMDGYVQGKKDEQAEMVYKKHTMNEIREACGFSRVEKEEVK